MQPTQASLHPEDHVVDLECGVLTKVNLAECREQSGWNHIIWVQNHHILACNCEQLTQLL